MAAVVSREFQQISSESDVEAAIKTMVAASVTEAYLLDEGGSFRGKVSLHSLLSGSKTTKIVDLCEANPLSIKHDASLQQAIEVASRFVGESIPVINRDSRELLGVVTEADLFQLYLRLQTRIADLEKA